jgi:hypothetical protein
MQRACRTAATLGCDGSLGRVGWVAALQRRVRESDEAVLPPLAPPTRLGSTRKYCYEQLVPARFNSSYFSFPLVGRGRAWVAVSGQWPAGSLVGRIGRSLGFGSYVLEPSSR